MGILYIYISQDSATTVRESLALGLHFSYTSCLAKGVEQQQQLMVSDRL